MKISLIIPAYNEGKYIGECLREAIKNGGSVFSEIIVIDNASTDDTTKIAASFPHVRVVREEKKGLTKARERGLQEASGDVLAYIDADTRMPSGWGEAVLREFTLHDNLAALSGPYIYYDVPLIQQWIVRYLWWGGLAMPFYLYAGYMLVGGNFAIRRSVLQKMGGFDTSIEFYGEDTDIARRASKFGKVKFKPSFVMYTSGRRFHGQGIIKTGVLYGANFLSEIFLRRPVTQKYEDIR